MPLAFNSPKVLRQSAWKAPTNASLGLLIISADVCISATTLVKMWCRSHRQEEVFPHEHSRALPCLLNCCFDNIFDPAHRPRHRATVQRKPDERHEVAAGGAVSRRAGAGG